MAHYLTSNQITTIDLTDNRSFTIHITSNLPTTQIYDASTNTYAPDWMSKNLTLNPQVFVGSSNVELDDNLLTIQWQRQEGTNEPTILTTGETVSGNNLIVSRNILAASASGFITYICTAIYDGMTTTGRISFNLTSSGTNGTNSYVHIKYGTAVPPPTLLDTPNDYMGIYSGTSPVPPTSYSSYRWFKIKGSDGTSVTIKDTAYYSGTITDDIIGERITIYVEAECLTPINISNNATLIDGDAYIVAGYLCVYNSTSDDFICTGQIQGPKGDTGVTYYTWIKYADSPTSTTLYDTPTAVSGLKYIGIAYNKLTQEESKNYADYTWAKFVGEDGADAKYVIVTGDQVFKSTDGGSTYSPAFITLTATLCGGLTGYQWYKDNVLINGATAQTYKVSVSDFDNTATYKCVSGNNFYDSITLVKVSDGSIGAAASIAFLTNENMVFLANSDGLSIGGTSICSVVAYTGNTKVTPVLGTPIGMPDGVSVDMGDEYLNEIPLTITVNAGTVLDASGTIYIPVTYPVSTTLELRWQRSDAAKDSIIFQLYAPDGYILSKTLNSLTLQTFAYDGGESITTNVQYTWYRQDDSEWVVIDGQGGTSITITQEDIFKSKSYQCVMNYKGVDYYAIATVQDRNDIYTSTMYVSSNLTAENGENYWVLYTLVYSDANEIDPLLGSVSINEPETPLVNDYWYSIDQESLSVTLKKFNGTNWESSSDRQSLDYYWNMVNGSNEETLIGDSSKVKIISVHDFTSTITLMCEVSNQINGVLTQTTSTLTDVSDPIVSDAEPTNVKHGQIWIKKNTDGSFLMFVWDNVVGEWVMADADTRNKVYTSRPSAYKAGDLWITASDDDHGTYLQGTLLQAQVDNIAYDASDWSPTLKYDQDIDDMKDRLDNLSQYVTISDDGLRIGARTDDGELSPFTSLFTSTELSFYQNSDKLLTLANNKLTTPSVEVETHLQVNGTINLGNLRLLEEDNGSFSFVIMA